METPNVTKDDFLKKVIIAMAIFLTIFTIIMIVVFLIMGDVPDVLITAVFAACLGEGSICGILKKQKLKLEEGEEAIEEDDEDDGSSELDFSDN